MTPAPESKEGVEGDLKLRTSQRTDNNSWNKMIFKSLACLQNLSFLLFDLDRTIVRQKVKRWTL